MIPVAFQEMQSTENSYCAAICLPCPCTILVVSDEGSWFRSSRPNLPTVSECLKYFLDSGAIPSWLGRNQGASFLDHLGRQTASSARRCSQFAAAELPLKIEEIDSLPHFALPKDGIEHYACKLPDAGRIHTRGNAGR